MATHPLPIVYYPDPVLKTPAEPIETVDDEIVQLGQDMIEAMVRHEGIGLAGPQVGVGKRIVVISTTGRAEDAVVHVDPRVVARSREEIPFEEGCLSFPGIRGLVVRPEAVVVESLDLEGKIQQTEADELLARVFQHEIDHLDGILFITKFGPADKLAARRKLKQLEKEHAAAARK